MAQNIAAIKSGDYNKDTVFSKSSGTGGNSTEQSKGGHQPKNLKEKLAVDQAKSSPDAGRPLQNMNTDPRWPASDGWQKMTQNINGVEVHYQYNPIKGLIDDFKIK
jgi:hypothetical protein